MTTASLTAPKRSKYARRSTSHVASLFRAPTKNLRDTRLTSRRRRTHTHGLQAPRLVEELCDELLGAVVGDGTVVESGSPVFGATLERVSQLSMAERSYEAVARHAGIFHNFQRNWTCQRVRDLALRLDDHRKLRAMVRERRLQARLMDCRGVELVLGGERLGVRRRADTPSARRPARRATILRASSGRGPRLDEVLEREQRQRCVVNLFLFEERRHVLEAEAAGKRFGTPGVFRGLRTKVARVGLANRDGRLALYQRLLARLELPGHFGKLARRFWGRRRRQADGVVARVIRQARRGCHESKQQLFILDPFREALGAALLVLRPYVWMRISPPFASTCSRMLLSICLIWSGARARGSFR